jgi:3-oxoacyl-[acyl-carrier protein] reductase
MVPAPEEPTGSNSADRRGDTMSQSNGKVAIVTGASRGIGRAIAERFARDGMTVVVNYARSAADAEAVVDGIEARGGRALALQADVGSAHEVRRLVRDTVERCGRLDVLVNNAAVAPMKPASDVSERELGAAFAVNAFGPFFAMQEAARVLPSGGRIINISSGATTVGFAGFSAYLGSKAALEQFSLVFANELGARGITVNTILVGVTRTRMLDEAEAFFTPQVRGMLVARTPLGRLGEPSDIADAVSFLAGEDARWVTGQSIRVDGGIR